MARSTVDLWPQMWLQGHLVAKIRTVGATTVRRTGQAIAPCGWGWHGGTLHCATMLTPQVAGAVNVMGGGVREAAACDLIPLKEGWANGNWEERPPFLEMHLRLDRVGALS